MMPQASQSVLKRVYCNAEECLHFAVCPDSIRPEVRLFAEVAREKIRFFSSPERMKCYELELPAKFQLPPQPRSRRSAQVLYGKGFNNSLCINLCTASDTTAWWQCGRPNGHGMHGLWCPQHAVEAASR